MLIRMEPVYSRVFRYRFWAGVGDFFPAGGTGSVAGGVHRPGADKRSAVKFTLNVPGTECLDHKRNDCRPERVDCVLGGGNLSGLLMDIAASML